MTKRVCSRPGCPRFTTDGGRCDECRRDADKARGTAAERGYTSKAHRIRFRQGVLARHPVCVDCRRRPSTVADHHPMSRRELIDAGLDPNDPQYGRGLCKGCHDRHTAQAQPGGWNARTDT